MRNLDRLGVVNLSRLSSVAPVLREQAFSGRDLVALEQTGNLPEGRLVEVVTVFVLLVIVTILLIRKSLRFREVVTLILVIKEGCRVVLGVECERVCELRHSLLSLLAGTSARHRARHGHEHLGTRTNAGAVGLLAPWELIDRESSTLVGHWLRILENVREKCDSLAATRRLPRECLGRC
jgi:hypothetical protein